MRINITNRHSARVRGGGRRAGEVHANPDCKGSSVFLARTVFAPNCKSTIHKVITHRFWIRRFLAAPRSQKQAKSFLSARCGIMLTGNTCATRGEEGERTYTWTRKENSTQRTARRQFKRIRTGTHGPAPPLPWAGPRTIRPTTTSSSCRGQPFGVSWAVGCPVLAVRCRSDGAKRRSGRQLRCKDCAAYNDFRHLLARDEHRGHACGHADHSTITQQRAGTARTCSARSGDRLIGRYTQAIHRYLSPGKTQRIY